MIGKEKGVERNRDERRGGTNTKWIKEWNNECDS
jgi:hypothetical protein